MKARKHRLACSAGTFVTNPANAVLSLQSAMSAPMIPKLVTLASTAKSPSYDVMVVRIIMCILGSPHMITRSANSFTPDLTLTGTTSSHPLCAPNLFKNDKYFLRGQRFDPVGFEFEDRSSFGLGFELVQLLCEISECSLGRGVVSLRMRAGNEGRSVVSVMASVIKTLRAIAPPWLP